MKHTVGILALQGAYQRHVQSLSQLGVKSRLVRKTNELEGCDALILPGGESTTISLLMQTNDLYKPIKAFAAKHPVMGVCAGMIMMAESVNDKRVTPLGLMPFTALRNFYGRQLHSFAADITLHFYDTTFPGQFIRAPSIKRVSAEINVLATYNGEAVMIGRGKHIALSFHPELTNDTRIHKYWLSKLD